MGNTSLLRKAPSPPHWVLGFIWLSFTDSKDVQKVMAKLIIKVRGGRMAKE
jgi:hypothetical protein